MSATSSIEWTEKTWNPVRGCSIVSPGCVNCYAMKQAHRFSYLREKKGHLLQVKGAYHGLTKQTSAGPQWTGDVRCIDEALDEPLHWRKPQRIFVNSMSDLFHEDVPDAFIDRVWGVMRRCPQHTFQILTKRAERMRAYFEKVVADGRALFGAGRYVPLPNVWLIVSVENQSFADERIPQLLQIPAVVRGISAEPLLGPIDLTDLTVDGYLAFNALRGYKCWPSTAEWSDNEDTGPHLDWVIVGGESGPGARPVDVAWARSIVQQCKVANVPVFVKQLGAHVIDRNDAGFEGDTPRSWPMDTDTRDLNVNRFQGDPVRVLLRKKGGVPHEWPEDLRVREFPEARA